MKKTSITATGGSVVFAVFLGLWTAGCMNKGSTSLSAIAPTPSTAPSTSPSRAAMAADVPHNLRPKLVEVNLDANLEGGTDE